MKTEHLLLLGLVAYLVLKSSPIIDTTPQPLGGCYPWTPPPGSPPAFQPMPGIWTKNNSLWRTGSEWVCNGVLTPEAQP